MRILGCSRKACPRARSTPSSRLDSQDWMAPKEIHALWNAIDRTGRDNVRVLFCTAGAESPLERAELAPLRQIWCRDEERSAAGFARDRSGIYGGFHCYGRR